MEKTILLLANSCKNGGRCLAGREIHAMGGRLVAGPWVRPLGDGPEGSLEYTVRRYDDGREASVLDVVRFRCTPLPAQPHQAENVRLAPGQSLVKVGTIQPQLAIRTCLQQPGHLWLPEDMCPVRNDRIPAAWLNEQPIRNSLYLIRPMDAYLLRTVSRSGQPQLRCIFTHNTLRYSLVVTDPRVKSAYLPQPEGRYPLPGSHDNVLCLSLGGELNGYHYKLVATILSAGQRTPPALNHQGSGVVATLRGKD